MEWGSKKVIMFLKHSGHQGVYSKIKALIPLIYDVLAPIVSSRKTTFPRGFNPLKATYRTKEDTP